jgi:hypothetical protein
MITLSIEEAEMSRFLKSQSTYDLKTKAGKLMAAVGKAQNFSSQQRTALRLPLSRLYNEVETFRNQAIRDSFLTVRKMEIARTEYRGSLLWMRNASMELDPDTGRKLEKFRQIQAQVKNTKTKFDRLKSDVIQKIDLLSASRCNMFSHVLVNYLQTIILYWQKTAKTMNAVSEAYKGYQHYEFNIIKDLAEPSRRLADNLNRRGSEKEAVAETVEKQILDESDAQLIDIDQKDSALLDLSELERPSEQELAQQNVEDEVNELIDLMTLTETNILNEQLAELEKLEQEKRQRNAVNGSGSKVPDVSGFLLNKTPFDFLNSTFSKSSSNTATTATIATALQPAVSDLMNQNLFDTTASSAAASGVSNSFRSFTALMSKASDDFEKEWQSAFSSATVTAAKVSDESNETASPKSNNPFGSFFSSPTHTGLFSSHLMKKNAFDNSSQKLLNPSSNSSGVMSASSSSASAAATAPTSSAGQNDKQSKVCFFIGFLLIRLARYLKLNLGRGKYYFNFFPQS